MQVLIIEDEQRVADFLARGLKAEGYFPSVVNDGAEALHAIRTQQPALVILDRMLPGGVDGLRGLVIDGGEGFEIAFRVTARNAADTASSSPEANRIRNDSQRAK